MKFYLTLKRNDGGGSCCNLMDCRPTQSRMVGDHYEVKVDGATIRRDNIVDLVIGNRRPFELTPS